jgi:hypothetical protein
LIQQLFEDVYRKLPGGDDGSSEFSEGSLAGRGEGQGSGELEEITVGTGLLMTGRTLSVDPDSVQVDTYYAPLTDGDEVETELIFADGECVMVEQLS